ncbi:MAG: cobalamin-dependent protein, partial [Alphaproteobacteria bacterium]|nr:cobalamin-dependent protein [Alphaproteobacteria bacterium]
MPDSRHGTSLAGTGTVKDQGIKVVLVYPSSRHSVQTLYTFNRNQSIGFKPPLSILILATYLRAKGFFNVHCLDAQMEDLTPEETAARLAEMRPDVVGITAWTDFWYPCWKTVEETRRLLPKTVIVLGGPHCGVYPRETTRAAAADYVVCGDGEDVLLDLVTALSRGEAVPVMDGLWRKENGAVVPPPEPLV